MVALLDEKSDSSAKKMAYLRVIACATKVGLKKDLLAFLNPISSPVRDAYEKIRGLLISEERLEEIEKLGKLVDFLDVSGNSKMIYLRARDLGLDTNLLKKLDPGWSRPEVKTFTSLEEILKEIGEKKESLKKDLELVKNQEGSIYSKKKLATANLFFGTLFDAVNMAIITGDNQRAVNLLESFQTEYREHFDKLYADDKEFWNSVISFLKSKVAIQADSSTPTKPSAT